MRRCAYTASPSSTVVGWMSDLERRDRRQTRARLLSRWYAPARCRGESWRVMWTWTQVRPLGRAVLRQPMRGARRCRSANAAH